MEDRIAEIRIERVTLDLVAVAPPIEPFCGGFQDGLNSPDAKVILQFT